MPVSVRPATPADAGLIHQFILDLADYEKLLDEVTASESDTAAALFGDNARAFADIAELDGQAVGFALWFYNYSTFVGRHGIYLEDLFVRPAARGSGAGKALLANLAKRCVDEGLGRLEWSVLDWNAPSIAFYDSLGAAAMDEWIIRRLTGEGIRKLAGV
ncbi:GNAT family N-acetyltransferase [Caulobacter sp. RL271]|jgi:GNAT superfamily N-acetyltransferase|uniref:GNAT family N-acetyltransferase n=1 Tax=Caulobacter segnis TaxID=88688 RepID=A0ABY4ZWE1_9CAUL|nr:GNAT family N-acetyltransferase [Caulobacter segnis]USQ96479.1 GNAT family N-acetyltransferase [Caulobacter segnis]